MPRLRVLGALALAVSLQFTSTVFAQDRSITGRALDPQGAAVPHATIVATAPTAPPRTARTDAEGRFVLAGLADGPYDIVISSSGLRGEARGVAPGAPGEAIEIALQVSAIDETLLVSASQIDQPLSRTADSVTVITGADLAARQVSSLGGALLGVPGFVVATTGGPGTVTSVFPRGGESDYTLVLVDGVRANAFGGGIDLSQVPLADVERVEIVRGPQSAVFGADAIGGVVQVVTRRGGAPSAHALLETGSRSTRRAQASTTGAVGALRWQAGGDFFADDGFTGLARNGERVSNDDAESRQGWVGTGWSSARGTDLQSQFRYVDTDRGAPGAFGSDPARRFGGVDRISRGSTERRTLSVRVMHPWTGPAGRVRQRVEFDAADHDLRFVSAFGPSTTGTGRSHLRVQTDAVVSATSGVSGGVEWLDEQGASSFIRSATTEVPVDRSVVGLFGEFRWQPLGRVSMQTGLRAEHITRNAFVVNGFAEDEITSVNPKVSLSWVVSPGTPDNGARHWTRIRAAAGTGIRPPDVFEIAFTDNPGLKPERSRSVEVGVTQIVARGVAELEATVFFNRYDDLIVSVGSLRDVSRYRTDNVSNARASGVELGGRWQARRGLNLRASYTRLATSIRAVDGSAQAPSPYRVGDPLLRRPEHSAAVGVTWAVPRWTAFLTMHARGSTLDAEPAFGPGGGLYRNPGRTTIDLGGSARLTRGVDVLARVQNALDRDYEDVLGYPAPGRTAFVGVRVAVGR